MGVTLTNKKVIKYIPWCNELKNAAEENPKGYSKSKEGVPEDVSVSVYGHKYSCV